MKIIIDKCDYKRVEELIDSYLNDIVFEDGQMQLFNAKDLLSDILMELSIDKEE